MYIFSFFWKVFKHSCFFFSFFFCYWNKWEYKHYMCCSLQFTTIEVYPTMTSSTSKTPINWMFSFFPFLSLFFNPHSIISDYPFPPSLLLNQFQQCSHMLHVNYFCSAVLLGITSNNCLILLHVLCSFVFQAGKILLHYRDQHRQIITRFLIWGFILVCLPSDYCLFLLALYIITQ